MIREAMQLHQSGNLSDASELYNNALLLDSANSIATHYLGLVTLQLGHPDEAIRLIEKSIVLAPKIIEFRHNLAASHLQLGNTDRAIQILTDLIREQPDHLKNYLTLGECYLRANDNFNARKVLQRALKIDSSNQVLCITVAELALAHGDTAGALELLKDYSAPERDSRYWSLRASIHEASGNWTEATEVLEKLCGRDTADVDSRMRLGIARQNTGNWRGALACYDEVLASEPSHASTLRNRAVVLRALERIDESIDTAKHCVYLQPSNSDFHFVLAASYRENREFLKAAHHFEISAKLKADNFAAEKEAALSLLQAGEFNQAWILHETRHRWDATMPQKFTRPSRPVNYWSKISEYDEFSPIVVVGEQGIGDEIMFASVIPEVMKNERDLIIQVDSRLKAIFARSFPRSTVVTHENETPFRPIRLRMGSLPSIFRKNASDFERTVSPYLKHDPKRTEALKLKIENQQNFICGFSWKTINPFEQGIRSLDVRELCQSIKLPRISYINLQYDTSPAELAVIKGVLGDQFLGNLDVDLFDDLDGVASLIGCCDVVITIPNAVAHLAGALGAKTFALTPYVPSWRWIGDSTRCLWYKNLKILRQERRHDWRTPLASINQLLRNFSCPGEPQPRRPRFHSDIAIDGLLETIEALTEQGKHADAEKLTAEVLRSNPDDETTIKARSSQLFLNGKYGAAVDLLARITAPTPRNAPPRWDGEPFDGVLVVGLEPHLGEELLIGSLLTDLAKVQHHVVAEVDGRLLPIFRRSIPQVKFVARGERLGPIVSKLGADVKVAGSVELISKFMREPHSLQRTPWVKPDLALAQTLRLRYQSLFPNRRLVGLCWRSGRVLNAREIKSIPLDEFSQVLNSRTDAFISIQHGDIDRELEEFRLTGNAQLYEDKSLFILHNIDQLAAQIAALDVIVTVSNSTAHLACAIGRDTRVIVPAHYPILWHWGKPGVRNPWYPTATVIRTDMTDLPAAVFEAFSNKH